MGDFELTRLVLQRGLALTYLLAFWAAARQFRPLLGENGLLPAPAFIRRVPFRRAPSLFHLWPRDAAFGAAAWAGVALSLLALTGVSESRGLAVSMGVWAALWALYLSFVNVGQAFYAFGWESILLEAGLLAAFLGSRDVAAPAPVVWLLRWLLFRVMLGAGLIKLRADPCWRDRTCLDFHFETQPLPNPLSALFHAAPRRLRRAGVWFNHAAELAAPWLLFGPAAASAAAGLVIILFQASILASGNLAWLNFLTMVLGVSAFDGRWLSLALERPVFPPPPSPFLTDASVLLLLVTAALSVGPVRNLLSRRQAMNVSFNPLHLVGSYGAFGAVTRTRREVVLEGTEDAAPLSPSAVWREYEFRGKPGDPARRPPQVSPYHLRLDWLMWFLAMSPAYRHYEHPWFARLVEKLLQGDPAARGLLRTDPFPRRPPRFVRARLYEYRFAGPAARAAGLRWERRLLGEFLPPLALPGEARAAASRGER